MQADETEVDCFELAFDLSFYFLVEDFSLFETKFYSFGVLVKLQSDNNVMA